MLGYPLTQSPCWLLAGMQLMMHSIDLCYVAETHALQYMHPANSTLKVDSYDRCSVANHRQMWGHFHCWWLVTGTNQSVPAAHVQSCVLYSTSYSLGSIPAQFLLQRLHHINLNLPCISQPLLCSCALFGSSATEEACWHSLPISLQMSRLSTTCETCDFADHTSCAFSDSAAGCECRMQCVAPAAGFWSDLLWLLDTTKAYGAKKLCFCMKAPLWW